MIKPEMIPDEAYRAWRKALFSYKGGRASIAAALNAWPGMEHDPGAIVTDWHRDPDKIILPLTEQTND